MTCSNLEGTDLADLGLVPCPQSTDDSQKVSCQEICCGYLITVTEHFGELPQSFLFLGI
jgi:hypothetical protein